MPRLWSAVILSVLVGGASSLTAAYVAAQEFRVYSRIEAAADASGRTEVVSRSLALWHAGKVYDYIYSAGEVTVLEPARRRIDIFNSEKRLTTSADFDELMHELRGAEERLAVRIQEFEKRPEQSPELLDSYRFQLRPYFEPKFDSRTTRLVLRNPLLTYDVRGQSGVGQEVVTAYCNYADWMCRLNYVLHPQPVFPNARLALNEQLRKQRLMPLKVCLTARLSQPLSLQATHELTWTLNAEDRACIQRWETMRQDARYQTVPLNEYRRALLSHATARAGK